MHDVHAVFAHHWHAEYDILCKALKFIIYVITERFSTFLCGIFKEQSFRGIYGAAIYYHWSNILEDTFVLKIGERIGRESFLEENMSLDGIF